MLTDNVTDIGKNVTAEQFITMNIMLTMFNLGMAYGIGTEKLENIMQDKKPYNEQRERHGFWLWHSASGDVMLKCHFLYNLPYGYLYYKPLFRYNGEIRIEHEYHAR